MLVADPTSTDIPRATRAMAALLESIHAEAPFPDRLRRVTLSEVWFSDMLAWLLDVRGSHGFGTRSTRFRLGNSAVFREFHLASSVARAKGKGAALCDVVFLDLDARDGLLVAVENKLFTTNSPGQLEAYHQLIEQRYARAAALEYVYLTLDGQAPVDHGDLPERLGEGAAGRWRIVREGKGATRLVHSSKPRSPLYVGVMPNLSIALYGRRSRRRPFDKLLIPFGSNPDQVFNLMDHAARDIYPLHFGENYRRYLGPQRRLTAREVPERQAGRKLLAQVHRWRHEIQLLAQVARRSGTRPTGRDEQGGPLLPADHFEGHRPDQPDS